MNSECGSRTVGRVVGLWRYPVKSMAPEPLSRVDVSWFGLVGDRRWAFIRQNSTTSGFPWFTLRERNDLNRFVPTYAYPDSADTSKLTVKTPAGEIRDVHDPALGATLCEGGARVIKQNRGIFDTFPISLITTQTIASLGNMVGLKLSVQRFRPNLLIDATGNSEFPEDEWVGKTLTVGDLHLRVDKRDGRCVVITIDPETGERDKKVLRAVASERQNCLGVYGTTVRPGTVAVGDEVKVKQ